MKHGYKIEISGYGTPIHLFTVGSAADLRPAALRKRARAAMKVRGGDEPRRHENVIMITKLHSGGQPRVIGF